ncbi:MAG TPA: hypothetical protein VN285_13365 [Candidatus Deferrimicrobium sp.]|nr:hypothetical protein [Candidatus Deferrimicrobium sp.]
MKASVLAAVLVGAIMVSVVVTLADQPGTNQKADPAVRTIPASLSNLYPPRSPAPTYLLAMLGMARAFSGIVCDVLENDSANAQSGFGTFKKSYLEVSNMVPEWKQEFPLQPIEALNAALSTGDPSKIMPAVDEVGKICHNCHTAAMPPVQQKYRWNNFGDISVTDPISGQQVSYARFMLMMETNFDGIGVDVQQGQRDNALLQLTGFSARFQAMAEACMICHDSERKYYVDTSVTNLISTLQAELSRSEVNGDVVGRLLRSIGQESCSKCHLVHIPAAYAQ